MKPYQISKSELPMIPTVTIAANKVDHRDILDIRLLEILRLQDFILTFHKVALFRPVLKQTAWTSGMKCSDSSFLQVEVDFSERHILGNINGVASGITSQ